MMNQIINLLLLLTISSLFLPVTAIMYASGSMDTGGDEATSDTESMDTESMDTESMDTESMDTESMDTGGDEATSDTESTAISDILESASTNTGNETSDSWHLKSNHALDEPIIVTGDTLDSAAIENNATLNPLSGGGPNMTNAGLRLESNSTDTSNYPVYCTGVIQLSPCTVESNSTGNSTYPVYCSSCNLDIYTGGGDFASMILAGHNRVRADVGVAPLVWNDSLAASAQTWADHLAAEGRFYHDVGPNVTWGENISARGGIDPSVPAAHMQEFFFSEMNNYHGQAEGTESAVIGHYTQSVWNSTTSIGCATASSGGSDYLVCRYNPWGNTGRPAY
jgi:hypothetical protein